MRINLLAAVLLLPALPVWADAPPIFAPFESRSANSRYFARVEKSSSGDWVLSMLEGKRRLWRCKYRYSGYPGAHVSDDGRSVATVSRWFYEDQPVLEFYRKGGLTASVLGRDVPFDRKLLSRTASHFLWLSEEEPREGFDAKGLFVLRTRDEKTHRFDPATGRAPQKR